MKNRGIFACDVIKKRRYFTFVVPGKDMEDRFGGVKVGDTYVIQVTVDDII